MFGCYVSSVWMANYVYVIARMGTAFVYDHHLSALQASMENVTLCGPLAARAYAASFSDGWIQTLWGSSQPLVALQI